MPAVRMERTVGGSGLSPPAAAVGAKRTTHYREGSGEKEGRKKEGRKKGRRRKGEEREKKRYPWCV